MVCTLDRSSSNSLTSGSEVLLSKLVDGRYWARTHVAVVGLTVWSFPWFFLRSFHKCGLDALKNILSG